MDSVDVVNTLIDIILDEVTRNKMAHMVEDANISKFNDSASKMHKSASISVHLFYTNFRLKI